ncbi:MAG: serine/threonine-protein kinase [Vicinamibacterales bacterium]|nr:serine/threonine-protein kinase [Vicinamibacterales bacterium]
MLAPGAQIDGRYEILGPLGSGGMGQVYRARRVRLGDEVAIKVMHPSPGDDPELGERFLRESRACAQLRHPSIVSILDFSVDQSGHPYLVMELLSGPSLREELELGGAMPPATAARVLGDIAAALQLAHDRGITHRDLKPANIVGHEYGPGQRTYKIIDFGLASAKAPADHTRLTLPHVFLGTIAYAAPEQLRGEPGAPAADQYALGVTAYEMLTGRRPFEADNQATLIQQALVDVPVAPRERRQGLPDAVDAVVMRALEKAPADRWPSVAAFAAAFTAAAGGVTTGGTAAGAHAGLLARYELGPMLGRGRLGSLVYRGRHRALGLPVAIRVLKREEQAHWEAVRERFLVEARTTQVAHPHILQVRDVWDDEQAVYLVSDLHEGPSLREAMASQGPMPWARVQPLVAQILEATAALHRGGGFIAGVNPDMIRLTTDHEGDRLLMSTAGIRSVQDVLATMREQELRGQEASERELPYVAPEVLMGRAPDARADVFTAGVLAYQMLTGLLPFRARSLPELLGQMLTVVPAPVAALASDVPAPVSAALTRALAPQPDARFASATEMAGEVGE